MAATEFANDGSLALIDHVIVLSLLRILLSPLFDVLLFSLSPGILLINRVRGYGNKIGGHFAETGTPEQRGDDTRERLFLHGTGYVLCTCVLAISGRPREPPVTVALLSTRTAVWCYS